MCYNSSIPDKKGAQTLQTKKRTRVLCYILIGAALLATAGVVLWYVIHRPATPEPSPAPPMPTPEVVIREREVEKIVEVEKTVSAEILRDGLRDMGVLETEEYYFTEVISGSNMLQLDLDLKLFRINEPIPLTESSFLASYDGVVTAGIDFEQIAVAKDDELRLIQITLPHSEILHVDIDPESFTLYDEKKGIGTRITMEDYNAALTELERTAAAKAEERGLLQKADRNAETLIRNFVESMTEGYTIRFITAQ